MKNLLLKSALLALPFMLFIWLLALDIQPKGQQVIRYEIGDRSALVGNLVPAERVEGGHLLDGPVYMTLKLPNADFDTVEVDVEFEPGSATKLEFGPALDIFSRAFDLRPLYHATLEELDWFAQKDGPAMLYSRDVIPFDGLDIPFGDVRTYFANWGEAPNVRARFGDFDTRNLTLSGYHKLYLVIPEGLARIELDMQDMNAVEGRDDFKARLLNANGTLISEVVWDDDGSEGVRSTSLELDAGFVQEGIYTLELIGTSDNVIERIEAPYRRVVFQDRLLITEMDRADSFYTNARSLKIRATSAEGLQSIAVGGQIVELTVVGEWVDWVAGSSVNRRISLKSGGVEIVGEGYYANRASEFFEPDPLSLGSEEDLLRDGIDYIITTYEPAESNGDILSRKLVFNPNQYVDENNVVTFAFSVPGATELETSPEIHAVTFTFSRRSLSAKQLLSELKERIPFL